MVAQSKLIRNKKASSLLKRIWNFLIQILKTPFIGFVFKNSVTIFSLAVTVVFSVHYAQLSSSPTQTVGSSVVQNGTPIIIEKCINCTISNTQTSKVDLSLYQKTNSQQMGQVISCQE